MADWYKSLRFTTVAMLFGIFMVQGLAQSHGDFVDHSLARLPHPYRTKYRRRLNVCQYILQRGANQVTIMFPRRDPLDSFKAYDGCFNVTNLHYWTFVGFTRSWTFVMAFFCLLSSLDIITWCLVSFLFSHGRRPTKKMQETYILTTVQLFCIIKFSMLAIGSTSLIYWENGQLGKELKISNDYVVSNIIKIVDQIKDAVGALEDVWCGLCCKIICDHLGYGVKTGLPYVWRKEVGDSMVSLRREFKGVDWLEQIVPFFQAIRLPRSALTVEDCFGEIGRQVKEKLKIVDPVFAEVGSSMEDWIEAWKSVSS